MAVLASFSQHRRRMSGQRILQAVALALLVVAPTADAATRSKQTMRDRKLARRRWQQEKAAIQQIREKKSQLEQVRMDIEKAERAADYGKAAELKYGTLAALEREGQRRGRQHEEPQP